MCFAWVISANICLCRLLFIHKQQVAYLLEVKHAIQIWTSCRFCIIKLWLILLIILWGDGKLKHDKIFTHLALLWWTEFITAVNKQPTLGRRKLPLAIVINNYKPDNSIIPSGKVINSLWCALCKTVSNCDVYRLI